MSAHAEPPASGGTVSRSLRRRRLTGIMDRRPVVIPPDAPTLEVVASLRERSRSCALICEGERLVGIFTERDHLLSVAGRPEAFEAPVSEHMTPAPVTLDCESTLGDALRLFIESGYRHVPIADGDRWRGVVTVVDVVRLVADHFPAEVLNLPPRLDQQLKSAEGA